jgi:hypothetical protein
MRLMFVPGPGWTKVIPTKFSLLGDVVAVDQPAGGRITCWP